MAIQECDLLRITDKHLRFEWKKKEKRRDKCALWFRNVFVNWSSMMVFVHNT